MIDLRTYQDLQAVCQDEKARIAFIEDVIREQKASFGHTLNIGQRALYGQISDIGIALNYALFALINEGVDYGEENLR